MLHLSSERLAELADGEPTVAEAEHLAACAICATERSAHQRLLSLAGGERGRIAPPLTEWATLSQQLRASMPKSFRSFHHRRGSEHGWLACASRPGSCLRSGLER